MDKQHLFTIVALGVGSQTATFPLTLNRNSCHVNRYDVYKPATLYWPGGLSRVTPPDMWKEVVYQ